MYIDKLIKYLSFLFGFFILHMKGVKCGRSVNLSGVSDSLASIVSIFIFILVSSCFLQFVFSKINDKIPISLILFLFGMLIYGLLMSFDESKLPDGILSWLASVRRIDNSVLYYIALPILLYEATQTINWYSFCNFLWAGTSLAVIGVVLQVCILGILFHYALGTGEKWPFSISFLLASILSSTDPVAVLSVLNDSNAPNRLITMFNGESLINDGTSVLLFQFFYLMTIGQSTSFWDYLLLFIKLLLLSPLVGLVCGTFVIVWVSFFRKYHIVQTLISVSMGYLLFFCSEYYMNISGPLSIVCYGLFVKAYGLIAFDREALEKHDVLVEGLSYISNYSVFLVSGILTIGMLKSEFVLPNIGTKIIKLVGVYVFLNVARTAMFISFRPVLSYTGYHINYKEMLLLIWGGLRGAIVLVLGLRLENDTKIENMTTDLLSFYIAGSSMLILVFQGFTFNPLYRMLNPYPMDEHRREHLNNTMTIIDGGYEDRIEELKRNWLFRNSDVINKSNLLVPKLTNITWDKMGILKYNNPNIIKLDDLIVIEELKEVVQEQEEVDEEENIFLFNQELLESNQFQFKLLNEYQSNLSQRCSIDFTNNTDNLSSSADPNDANITSHIGSYLSKTSVESMPSNFTSNLYNDEPATIKINKNTDEELTEEEKEQKENKLKKEDKIYVIIFNALSYIYDEMHKNNFIDGKTLITLQTTLNISLDFAINKLHHRSVSAWKSIWRSIEFESKLIYDVEYGREFNIDNLEMVEKMNGFEFEWFVLRSNLEEILNRRLNFIKRANVSFILDLILTYIEAHEKLVNKPTQLLENVLDKPLYQSYLKQINLAKKYVFIIKNKINIKFYYCLLTKTASNMINLKKDVVDQYYANGMLLNEDRKQIINLLDYEQYKITNKTQYIKIIRTIFRKFYYFITCNKKMHTTTNPV